MFDMLVNWFRRHSTASVAVKSASAAEMQHPLQRYYLGPKGEELPSATGARHRGETNKLPDGLTETLLYQLEEPEWLERRILVGPYDTGLTPCRRTRYWPWGAERLRVALSYAADGQPQVEVHEYFPNGELRRHQRLSSGHRTMLYAFREPQAGEEYAYVEQMPQYPGGMEAFMRDLRPYLKYPTVARIRGLQGRILISFTVGPAGVMGSFTAPPDASPILAQAAIEALRQVARLRRWQPGMRNRRRVWVSYSVPITFAW